VDIPTSPPRAARVASIDVFRGFVMFLMLAEAMQLWTLHDAFPQSTFWAIVAFNTTHVPWQGCSLHDLIQPAFSFLAGAALPFSIASRQAKGDTFGRMLAHAAWRSLALILLGIFLRSLENPHTYWTFEDTLTQIGLGYTFLFLLALASLRVQVSVPKVHVQPVPLIAVAVSPVGSVSATVTVPLVGPGPTLLTVIVYVAPVCPCVKLPVCVLFTVRSATCVIVVGSLAVSLAVLISPPPDTLAVLVTDEGALLATFTVRVMAG